MEEERKRKILQTKLSKLDFDHSPQSNLSQTNKKAINNVKLKGLGLE